VGRIIDGLEQTPEWQWVMAQVEADQQAHEMFEDGPDRYCHGMGSPGSYASVADWYEAQEDEDAAEEIAEEYHRNHLSTPHARQPHGGRLVIEKNGTLRPPMMQYPAHRDAEPIKHQREERFYDGSQTARVDDWNEHVGRHEVGVHERNSREDHYEPEEYWDEAGGGAESSSYIHLEGPSTRPARPRGVHPDDEAARVRFQKRASELATARALTDPDGRSYEHHLARAQRELAEQPERIGPAPLRRRARYCKSSAAPGVRGQRPQQFTGGLSSYRDASLVGAAAAKCGCTFEEMMSAVANQR
jgi:hypothetical protein